MALQVNLLARPGNDWPPCSLHLAEVSEIGRGLPRYVEQDVSQVPGVRSIGAILNAMLAADTMTGADGVRVFVLPRDRFQEAMKKYGRKQGRNWL